MGPQADLSWPEPGGSFAAGCGGNAAKGDAVKGLGVIFPSRTGNVF